MKYGTHEWCSMYIIIKHEMNQEKANLIITATSIRKIKVSNIPFNASVLHSIMLTVYSHYSIMQRAI